MRVLITEDEPIISDSLQKRFRRYEIAADIAPTGAEALNLAKLNDYDVILLDIRLPDMMGFEVCHTLRERGIITPVIMLSAAHISAHDKVRGLDVGADDYLSKPFNFDELLARIRAAARRKTQLERPLEEVDGLLIDSNKMLVQKGGKMIKLTRKQFRLLEYFVKHYGKAVSRFDILENVWGSGGEYLSNVVDVHVAQLRRKLGKNPSKKPYIQTVRGMGYILGS